MNTTRMTASMKRSLEIRLKDLDRRIEALNAQREGDEGIELAALLEQLTRERSDTADALRDATLIDNEPFDTDAIEVGDTVTIRISEREIERYVLVDNMRTRARSDWVSISSPLGAAILGRGKGDEVHVESPSGTMSYVIVDFERAAGNSVLLSPAARARALLPSEAFLG
jgi:transcription elongation GreA/GreB family factor